MPSPLQISLKVVGLDQARADLQQFAQGGKRSFEELAAEARTLSATSAQSDRALAGVANRVRALAADIDPAAAASVRLRNQLVDIDRAQRANLITTQQAATLTARLRAENDNLAGSAARAATSTGQVRFAVQNLGFQINDIATSLASGSSPFQVMAQQGGQVVQAFQQGGGVSTVLGATASGIRSMITPTTAAAAAAVALGGGFAMLLARASSNAEQLRQFNLILQGTGRNALTTAENLQKVVRELREVGVSREDATTAVTAIARNPRLNPAQAGRISQIGLDVGARLGIGSAEGIERFTAAITGGVEDVLKLGFAMSALTVAEATNIREMARHGQQAEALRKAIDAVAKAVDGDYKRSLTEGQKAANSLAAAWSNFIDKLADTSAIQGARRLLLDLLGTAAEVAERGPLGAFTAAGERASQRAIAARRDMDEALRQRDIEAGGSGTLSYGSGVLDRLIRSMIQTESGGNPNAVSRAGAAGLMQIMPGTARDLGLSNPLDPFANVEAGTRYIAQLVREFGNLDDALKAYNWGPGNMRAALAGRKSVPASVEGYSSGILSAAALTGRETAADLTLPDADKLSAVTNATKALAEAEAERTRITKLAGIEQEVATARQQAYQQALAETGDATIAAERAEIVATATRERANNELQKAAAIQDAQTQGLLRSADAFRVSEAAGYRATAAEQAHIEVMQRGGDVAARTEQILREGAAAAIVAGQQQLAAMQPQVAALERLAEATGQGTDAAREAALENEAALRTQNALARAEATRNPELIAQARALNEAAVAEAKRAEAARQSIRAFDAANDNQMTLQAMQVEAGAIGLPPEEIRRRLDYLQVQQRLAVDFADASEDARRAYAETSLAIADARVELVRAHQEQQRWDDMVRSMAGTVENTLGQAFEDIFSGKKIDDWGERLKAMLGRLATELASGLFLRPLFESTAAYMSGLFSGAGGGMAALGGGAAASGLAGGSVMIAGAGGQVVNLGTLSSGASLLNSFSGGGGLLGAGGLGGIGSWLNNSIGPSLGFWGGVPYAPGLFGTTTLTSFLGGAGAGFGAGSLLNSLLGGNQLGGMIGSGLGALGGAALGSIIPGIGTLIGGLIGGAAGGGIGGMFGNSRPSNMSSGAFIDLASGGVSGWASSGNAQNDQNARQISESIAQFSRSIQQLTGGRLAGSINPDVGSRDGIQLNYDISGFGAGKYTAASVEEAVNLSKLAMARSLEGITDTVRQAIAAVSDPADLEAAVRAAVAYEKIGDAFREAFSSLPGNVDPVGPFEAALNQIRAIFQEISTNAQKFGLSLEPVNAALAEAERRLRDDFASAVETTFNATAGGAAGRSINTVREAWKQYGVQLADAAAIGLSTPDIHHKLEGIFASQVKDALANLTVDEIDQVAAALNNLGSNVFPELAASARKASSLAQARFQEIAEFQEAVTAALNNAAGRAWINDLRQIALWRDEMNRNAAALGIPFDPAHGMPELNQITHRQWTDILKDKTVEDLQAVANAYNILHPELANLARHLINVANAANAAQRAQNIADFNQRADAAHFEATGAGFINQLTEQWQAILRMGDEGRALGLPIDQPGGADYLNQIVTEQWTATMRDRTAPELRKVIEHFDTLNPKIADLARNLLATTEAAAKADFNQSIADAIQAIEDPLGAMIEAERRAGAERLRNAQEVAGNLADVHRLNALQIEEIWKRQTQSLVDLRDELTGGSLSGRREVDLSAAANDNFQRLIGLVTAGDTAQMAAAAQAGADAVRYAVTAYGNAPQTEALRASIVAAIEAALAARSFAGGTDWTPPGAIIVGERGPEVLYQRGGMGVAPNGAWRGGPSGSANLIAEIRALRGEQSALLRVGNEIARAVAAEIVRLLEAQLVEARRTPLTEPARRRVA